MFEFSAGSPALCLVDTVRDRGGACTETLRDPCDLDHWLRAAALLGAGGAQATERDLRAARELRDAIFRSAAALIDRATPADNDIDTINRAARLAPPRPQWRDGQIEMLAEDAVAAAFSLLAADAVAILSVPLIDRVRLCPECRMMFVDRSPAARRRWCSSASGCGNRAKVRAHRARQAIQEED